MAYYDALITAWASLSGTTQQKLVAINAMTEAGPSVDVPVSAIEGYMSLRGLPTAMEDWVAANPSPSAARTAAKELLRTIASPHVTVVEASGANVLAAVTAMLDALVSVGVMTAQNKVDLLSLSASTVPWWKAHGYAQQIDYPDLMAAGGLT